MKNYKIYLILPVIYMLTGLIQAQVINWGSLKEDHNHIVNVNIGGEFGIIYGLGYGYQFRTKLFEIVPVVEYSFPSGSKIFDDFKSKAGVQIRWFEFGHFKFNTRIQGIFRRQENDFVRLLNFGSDMAGVLGYYRTKWFIAGEVGFDKAIVTDFKHSQAYRDQYEGVVDGWYEPSTGGNFYYGGQAGYSFKQHDLYVKGGAMVAQDFKTKPFMPFFFQLGYNLKLGKGAS